ncbi:MAG: hypothetical protein IIA81_03040 [Thaumarchaeota archaeon]|nr:hypothetical protein [Nitrososphaerota archaeon]
MGKTTLEAFQCDRCGHAWLPRLKIDGLPTICPKCKSAYWNKPRRIDLAKQEVKPRVSAKKQRKRYEH